MNREKEYAVRVDKKISGFFLNKMSYGMNLGDFITKPCEAKQTGFDEFNIILTEGKKTSNKTNVRRAWFRREGLAKNKDYEYRTQRFETKRIQRNRRQRTGNIF